MDFSILTAALLNKVVTFFLDLFLNGVFDFLSDVLFGGSSSGVI
jgi:hypothetical protein